MWEFFVIGLTQTVFTTSFLRGETPIGTAKLCVKHGEHCEKCVLCVSPALVGFDPSLLLYSAIRQQELHEIGARWQRSDV
jgi:hypothetical protein